MTRCHAKAYWNYFGKGKTLDIVQFEMCYKYTINILQVDMLGRPGRPEVAKGTPDKL